LKAVNSLNEFCETICWCHHGAAVWASDLKAVAGSIPGRGVIKEAMAAVAYLRGRGALGDAPPPLSWKFVARA